MNSLLLALLFVLVPQGAAAPASANVWQGKNAVYEEQLKNVSVVRMVDISTGVTHPRRAYAEPGGPIESFAWKVLPPGRRGGYWESYKSEVAAYELDKLLDLNMVPVVVERTVKGDKGAAILWLQGVKSWDDALKLPKPPTWTGDLVRMEMFDCFIGNPDRNKGNMLADGSMKLYLIDHSRAFIDESRLPDNSLFQHVDPELWKRMLALDEATLQEKIGPWVERGSIKGMLARRDKMKTLIDRIVKKLGRAAYVR